MNAPTLNNVKCFLTTLDVSYSDYPSIIALLRDLRYLANYLYLTHSIRWVNWNISASVWSILTAMVQFLDNKSAMTFRGYSSACERLLPGRPALNESTMTGSPPIDERVISSTQNRLGWITSSWSFGPSSSEWYADTVYVDCPCNFWVCCFLLLNNWFTFQLNK